MSKGILAHEEVAVLRLVSLPRSMLLVAPALLLALAAYRLPPDEKAKPARIRANANLTPAGVLQNGQLTLRLEAKLGEWRPNGDDNLGAVVQAFSALGKSPQIPGPMIRVPAGTRVAMSIRNSIPDSTLIVHGLHDRPFTGKVDSLEIRPGETREVRFRLDAPGSYFYWATSMHRPLFFRTGLDAQLSGAIVVDGPGESAARDRVLVIGHWGDTVGGAPRRPGSRALFVVNGRSWPATERFKYQQGDTIRWRVINTSSDIHPMHLHGFYFSVNRRGDSKVDTAYSEGRRSLVYTEFMRRGTTMSMSWVPYRPGNWLFHCHIPEHFGHRGPLGILVDETAAPEHSSHANHALEGMSGLIVGVEVSPNPKAPASANGVVRHPERRLRLLVRPSPGRSSDAPGFAYTLHESGPEPPIDRTTNAGPPIIVQRNQHVAITVVNRLNEPTAVHWHGIELESYFDGVAGFSGAGRQITPAIAPGDSFVAHFTPPRAGTFIYHSHVAEPRQLRGGLGGALIVVDSVNRFDPSVDFPMLLSTPKDSADRVGKTLLNGTLAPKAIQLRVGGAYRFRFINITTDRPGTRLEFRRDTVVTEWKIVAKDGVDRAPEQRQLTRGVLPISIGESYDIEIAPDQPGHLNVRLVSSAGVVLMELPLEVLP